MNPFDWIEMLNEIQNDGHKSYLETWSIMTLGAEADGKYNDELIFRMLQNQQNIASNIDVLASTIVNLITLNDLKHIEP